MSGTVYWSYPILPFGIVVCTFFPTTFLEIAVYWDAKRQSTFLVLWTNPVGDTCILYTKCTLSKQCRFLSLNLKQYKQLLKQEAKPMHQDLLIHSYPMVTVFSTWIFTVFKYSSWSLLIYQSLLYNHILKKMNKRIFPPRCRNKELKKCPLFSSHFLVLKEVFL